MLPAPLAPDEGTRLAALRRLGILDSGPEERFDRLTRMAQRVFGVPMAAVNLLDFDRVVLKSKVGVAIEEAPRSTSFCAHTILEPGVMEIRDALLDPRFADNPAVVADPGIRFYAGCPITGPGGASIGAFCIMDCEPRALEPSDLEMLVDMAAMVERELAVTQLAVDDELTGLCNRLGFFVVATQALSLCERLGRPGTVVFADVNGLKQVNDVHGHEDGDRLLRLAGVAMGEAFGDSDVVARLGGDEFAAFFAGAAGDPAGRMAAALLDVNDGLDAPWSVSMAVGSASFDPEAPLDLETLLRSADAEMYSDKRKNRRAVDR